VINALEKIREAEETSRLTISDDPFINGAENAEPSLAANSGVISIFPSPDTLESVNNSRFHFSPQTNDEETTAPA